MTGTRFVGSMLGSGSRDWGGNPIGENSSSSYRSWFARAGYSNPRTGTRPSLASQGGVAKWRTTVDEFVRAVPASLELESQPLDILQCLGRSLTLIAVRQFKQTALVVSRVEFPLDCPSPSVVTGVPSKAHLGYSGAPPPRPP